MSAASALHAVRAFTALLVPALLLNGCGGGGTQGSNGGDYKQVEVSLVDGPIADPASVGGVCVIQAPRLNAAQLLLYWAEPALSVMKHIGQSMETCMRGEAAPTMAKWSSFFDDRIDISYNGECPGKAYSCFWIPDLIMLDAAEIATEKNPPTLFKESLIGHELYHAIAGNYHP